MTKDQRIEFFYRLKEEIEQQFRKTFPDHQSTIRDWKGKDIRTFQGELRDKVGGYISEKWFYTHIKKEKNEKLPREDMLTMLAKYVGYQDWEDFLIKKEKPKIVVVEKKKRFPIATKKWTWKKIGVVTAITGGLFFLIFAALSSKPSSVQPQHQFCFIDADTKAPIASTEISVQLLKEGESPLTIGCDSTGCFTLGRGFDGKVRFIVNAPYYQVDTITRLITYEEEVIPLRADDYALMIHYFSTTKIKDWQKRREQLDRMIGEEAQIIQVSSINQRGMEMYNKMEFIDKMTMPLESLKNVKVLETEYLNGRIIYIRFMQE